MTNWKKLMLFLEENNAKKIYLENIKEYGGGAGYMPEVRKKINTDKTKAFILAFVWSDSKEGFEYWYGLEIKYLAQ